MDPISLEKARWYARLHDAEIFNQRFEELMPEHDTMEKAYQAVEDEYQFLFQTTKYTGYNSFRNARHRYVKKKLNRN